MWDLLSNSGVRSEYSDDRKKQIILSNRINVFALVIFGMILLVDAFNINTMARPGWDDWAVIIACAVHLLLNRVYLFRWTRVLMIIDFPFLTLIIDLLYLSSSAGNYFWMPYIPIALSMIPFLVFSMERDKFIILGVIAVYFLLTFNMRVLIDYFSPDPQISTLAGSFEPLFTLVPSMIFIFVNATVYYTLSLTGSFQHKLAETNKNLRAANTELNELNSTKDKFFRIIGHDLKASIGHMIQFSEHFERSVDRMSSKEIRSVMGSVKDSSSKGLKLLENLLAWARSQAGTIPFEPRNIFILDLSNEVIQLFSSTAKSKQIELNVHVSKDLKLSADYNMLHTILRNLVSNAIKYTKPGGTVVIGAIQVANHCELFVKDTGIGMSEKVIANLFHIDKAKSLPGTNNEQGTGIGLILCREFAERHNASLTVESEPSSGTTITLHLPT